MAPIRPNRGAEPVRRRIARLGPACLVAVTVIGGVTASRLAAQAPAGTKPGAMPAGKAGGGRWTLPKTAWGDPDLQGFWTNTTTTPLQRPPELKDKAVLTDAELAERERLVNARANQDAAPSAGNPGTYNEFWYERGRMNRRTSLIVDPPDGRLPPLTPAAAKRAEDDRRGRGPADSWTDRSAYERCITRSLPGAMMPGFYNHNYHILQTPDYVVLHVEMIHDARIVPIVRDARAAGRPGSAGTGASPTPANIRQWMGRSRGRWEGNTLVVETTNFNDKVREQGLIAFSTGENLTLTERFTRTDADTIDYQFTVNDPTFYTRPWTASLPMARFEGPIFEYACHEGNHGLMGILSGARAEEGAAAGRGRP